MNVIGFYNKEYKKREAKERGIILLCAAMRTNKVAEFGECLDEVRMNPEIKKLMEEEVFEMCQDENLIGRYYDKEEEEKKILKGIISEERKDAREEGFQDGVQNKQQEMILALNSEGVSIETIANASKLSQKEVKKIIATAKKEVK